MRNLKLGDFCLPMDKNMAQNKHLEDVKQAQRRTNSIRAQYDDLLSRYHDQQSEIFSLRLQIEELNKLIPQSTLSSLPSYAQVIQDSDAPKLKSLGKIRVKAAHCEKALANSNMETPTLFPIAGSASTSLNSKPILTPPPAQILSFTNSSVPTPPKTFPAHHPCQEPNPHGKSLLPPKRATRQTHGPEKVPVHIYHDSNLAWSGPDAIKDTIRRIFPKQSDDKDFNVSMCFTPKLEDVLQAVSQTDHANSVVVISVMTNNAKEGQSVEHTDSFLQRIINNLKRQTSLKNIIIMESPPSLQFDIYPYNRASYQICCSSGVYFALSHLDRCHIKDDGLHIRDPYKHLMIKSVAAAIMKVNPYIHFGLFPPVRRPWMMASWAHSFMMRTYPSQFQHSAFLW